MDKIIVFQKLNSTKIFLILIFFILSFMPALAQSKWSFKDNPYPKYGELNQQELKLLRNKTREGNTNKQCEYIINTQYQIYQNRYPEFVKYANNKSDFQRWRLYMVKSENNDSCMISNPMRYLVDNDSGLPYVHFYFCGSFSRTPITKEEKEIAQTISDLFEYAKTGNPASVDLLLYANERTEIINLYPEFEYYFSMLAKPFFKDETTKRDVSHLTPLLSKEHRKFLDEAALNLNFEALLITASPCKTR